jgi:WD40 repeat protein
MRVVRLPDDPRGHAAPITHVALRADGRRLATTSYDGTAIVWDVADPTNPWPLCTLRHRRLVNASAWNPVAGNLLATASADKTVVVWNVSRSEQPSVVTTLARHTDDVNSVAWMPDGERLVCVSEDGHASMWNALTGRFLGDAGAHAAHCMMVAVSRTGRVATVGEDGLVAVRDPDGTAPVHTVNYKASVEGCAWSTAGDRLAVTRDDGRLEILTADLEPVVSVPVSTSAARSVTWDATDSRLAVGGYDGAVHIVDADGQRIGSFVDERAWPRSVSSAAGLLAVGSFWRSPHLLRFDTLAELAAPSAPTHGPNALAAHGSQLLVGCDSGLIASVDVASVLAGNRPRAQVRRVCDGPILSLATGTGGVFAGTYAGRVHRLDGPASEPLGAPVPSLLCHGDTVLAGTYNGDLVTLDPQSLAVTAQQRAHDGSVKSLAAFGDAFVSGATDRTVAADDGTGRHVLWEHGNLVNAVASLDASVVASAARDHTVKVGRVERAHAWVSHDVQTLFGADESVKCVALLGSAHAPVVLAGSYDFHLYAWPVVWDDSAAAVVGGYPVAAFDQGISHLCRLGPDRAAVASWDGRIGLVELRNGVATLAAEVSVHDLVAAGAPDLA